ncbi:hypothetical protein ACLB2K_029848 [Fragaria x ananassa]
MDVQTRLITPICPHYAEHVWRNILKNEGFVVTAGWPVADAPDITLQKTNNFSSDTEKVIQEALVTICVDELRDLKEKLKECTPFIKLKKNEAVSHGAQALELKLPFEETEFLRQNLELIKRQVGLEEIQVLSSSNHDDRALAGSHAERIEQNPPVPGRPTAIFIE